MTGHIVEKVKIIRCQRELNDENGRREYYLCVEDDQCGSVERIAIEKVIFQQHTSSRASDWT